MLTARFLYVSLILMLGLGAVGALIWNMTKAFNKPPLPPLTREAQADAEVARRQALDKSVYAIETAAQRHELWFIERWDTARRAKHTSDSFVQLMAKRIRWGTPTTTTQHDLGIIKTVWSLPDTTAFMDADAWAKQVDAWSVAGLRVVESEWHHSEFTAPAQQPAHSRVSMLVHVQHTVSNRRFALRGMLAVTWQADDGRNTPIPESISVETLTVMEQGGDTLFQAAPASDALGRTFGPMQYLEPMLCYDVDHDGKPDLCLPGENIILRNQGDFQFVKTPLSSNHFAPRTAVIGDVTGDGYPDLLGVNEDYLTLVPGTGEGRFLVGMRLPNTPKFERAQVITLGDIDRDGDLDVFVAQYLEPYVDGRMPTPYYDANDGLPFTLLRNDQHGRFTDITANSGLAAKRLRRVYGASFADLNNDGLIDLLLSNDFAGSDIFYGDGRGGFTDVTTTMLGEPHNFGMGHAIADINGDGQLDLYLIGMSSTTARRLDHMRVALPDKPQHAAMRSVMGYGNRLYLGQGQGKPFQQAPFQDQVNRTGWSWGTVATDFDNDGDHDLFVANGFVSAESCKDYCTTFWRHDIYTGSSQPHLGLNLFFKRDLPDFSTVSWNGYEHNVLFLQEHGADQSSQFLSAGFPLGVAKEFDTRGVVAADFDGDGYVDLAVVEKHFASNQRWLHLYRNRGVPNRHWIGIQLQETPAGETLFGCQITLINGARRHAATVVTGDSFMSQQPAQIHFGLGAQTTVDAIEIRWLSGVITRLDKPVCDRWHVVKAPAFTAGK